MRTRVLVGTSIAFVAVALALSGCFDRNQGGPTAPHAPRYAAAEDPAAPVVNSLADPGDGVCDTIGEGDGCTLREAVAFASTGAQVDMTGLSGTISLGSQVAIGRNMILVGPGASTLTITGGDSTRLFWVGATITATISHVKLSHGHTAYDGGAVFNAGSLELDSVIVDNSSAIEWGGGVANGGFDGSLTYSETPELEVNDSWFAYNTATNGGGGAIYTGGGNLTIRRSTFNNNASSEGGGAVYAFNSADLSTTGTAIENSTFSANQSSGGAALYVPRGRTKLALSTIVGNTATMSSGGGGVAVEGTATSRLDIKGSIIAGNTGPGGADDVAAFATAQRIVSHGYNLIGAAVSSADLTTDFSVTGDLRGVNDPGTGTLGLNGGFAPTRALLDNSGAINAVSTAACSDIDGASIATDERGVSRPQQTFCDMGAYERVYVTPTFASSCEYAVGTNGRNTVTIGWSEADPGVTLVTVTVGGRTLKKGMAPVAADTISVKTAGGVPTYDIYSGDKRGATTNHKVSSGTCNAI